MMARASARVAVGWGRMGLWGWSVVLGVALGVSAGGGVASEGVAAGGEAGLEAEGVPRYVLVLIGDGMGPGQLALGDAAARAEAGAGVGAGLVMNTLPVRGWMHTRSADDAVTDSAASATALSTGVKTNNGMVNRTPGGAALRPITMDFRDAGMAVGLLTSVQINHATPAGFYGSWETRHAYDELAGQMAGSGVDLWAGRSVRSESGSEEGLRAAMERDGLVVVDSLAAAREVPSDRRLVLLETALANPDAEEGQLSEVLALAIERLDGAGTSDGFFVMVEGGAIDWEGHANKGWAMSRETLAFDRAVAVALRFYEEHPSETLVVVTADHETGGLSVDADALDVARLERLTDVRRAVEGGLNGALPESVTAETLAERLDRGLAEAGEVALSDDERAALGEALNGDVDNRLRDAAFAVRRLLDARAGLTWTTRGHSGVDVPLRAVGVGAERFEGALDNTELAIRLRALFGFAQGPAGGGS